MDYDRETICFACGAKVQNVKGECHEYMLSSPGCWSMYCEELNREYSDLKYWNGHQFSVDAYACQHVGVKEDKRAIRSVNIHLASLYMIFERGISLSEAPKVRSTFSQNYKNKDLLMWLDPPESFGSLTIADVWSNQDPDNHFELAQNWAESVWRAWSHQHRAVRDLVDNILIDNK